LQLIAQRHGPKDDNGNLTAKGKRLATDIARNYLPGLSITHIVASSTPRAMETAGFAEQFLGIEIIRCPELRGIEYSEEGMERLIEKIGASGMPWQIIWREGITGFESAEKLISRVSTGLGQIRSKLPATAVVLIVAHEETIWAMRHILQSVPLETALKETIEPLSFHLFEV